MDSKNVALGAQMVVTRSKELKFKGKKFMATSAAVRMGSRKDLGQNHPAVDSLSVYL